MWSAKYLLLLGVVLAASPISLTTSLTVANHSVKLSQTAVCMQNPELTVTQVLFNPAVLPLGSFTEFITIYAQNTSGNYSLLSSVNIIFMENQTQGIQTGLMQLNNEFNLAPNQGEQINLELNLDLGWAGGEYTYGVELYNNEGVMTGCGAGYFQVGAHAGFLDWMTEKQAN